MVVLKENGCRVCPKIFCCTDCRDVHEKSKHPNTKCSLCVKQDLPYKPLLNKDLRKNSEFFCHIVFNHLPLCCKLCGDKFTNNRDLLTAKSCRWWNEEFRRKQRVSQQPSVVLDDVPCSGENDSADLEVVNAEKKLPLTPVFLSSGDDSKSLQIAESSSILRLKQENFDSPPELVRHTSTPMHGVCVLGQKQLGTATIPQFVLKTPSSFDKHTFETTGSACSHVSSSEFESRYYTGISSSIDEPLARLSLSNNNNNNDNSSENQSEVDPSWNSPSCPVSKNQLPISAEVAKEKKERVERSIMKPDVLDRVSRTSDSSRDSIGKKVRFSDQCSNLPCSASSSTNSSVQETPADSSANLADSEIFFEAQQSLEEDESGPCDGSEPFPYCRPSDEEPKDEENLPSSTDACNNENNCSNNNNSISNTDNNSNCVINDKNDDQINKNISIYYNSSSNNNNNISNSDSNNNDSEKRIKSIVDTSFEENKSSTSSRVLMMFLVEKTDSQSLSNLDLRPLIDSGLKKLEKRVSSVNNSSVIDKGYHECSCKSSKLKTEVSSFARKVNSTFEDKVVRNHCGPKLRTPIKDNFISAGEKAKYQGGAMLPKQSQEVVKEEQRQVANKADSFVGSCMSDGIFSVVARVVRCAFKKLPAVGSITSRNLSRESLQQTACSPVRITTTSSFSITSTEVLTMGPSCNSSTSTSRIVLQRSTGKRPYDRLDSSEEYRHVPPRDFSGNLSSLRGEVVSSPAAKRHRGWYRIRAREPIARMRNRAIVSPRGASFETQRFQQGSLTVGDIYLPLPSRAHQSTQTE